MLTHASQKNPTSDQKQVHRLIVHAKHGLFAHFT